MELVIKNPPASVGDLRDVGLIPGVGKSPGGGHDNPHQYSCLGNPMDKEAWWATVHGVAKSWLWLSMRVRAHTHAQTYTVVTYKCESESDVAQSCPTLCDPMDCNLPGFSIHGIFQARILECIAISFSRGSSRPRNRTWVSCIAGRCFTL